MTKTCKCQHNKANHSESGSCLYTFCYCRYQTFTQNDGAMVEPLVVLA